MMRRWNYPEANRNEFPPMGRPKTKGSSGAVRVPRSSVAANIVVVVRLVVVRLVRKDTIKAALRTFKIVIWDLEEE